MITIFSAMRPFVDDIADVQLNAIRSWQAIRPACEVLLVEDEEGTTEAATRHLGVRVVSDVVRSRLGAPTLDSLLECGARHARGDILAYNTADVLLPPNFARDTTRLHGLMGDRPYLAIASRWDLVRRCELNLDRPDGWQSVEAAVKAHGRPHGHTAIDLWVYRRDHHLPVPPFPIGRCATDGWIVYWARREGIPVVDMTPALLLVHQFHSRPAKRSPLFYEEQLECVRLFDNMGENAMSVLDADWEYRAEAVQRPRGLRRLHAAMSFFRPYRRLIALRRRYRAPHLYSREALARARALK